jgi:cyclophilin family peptidyl-prolyl cis-trans isomerase
MNPAVLVLSLLLQAPAPAAVPAPEVKPAPTGPVVVFDTSLGVIKVALNPDKAPKTVANFLAYVKRGHYNGTIFHRVIPNFMVQGGGMLPDLTEKPAETKVQNEAKNGLRNLRGTIAMARTSDPHSASAQFFINVKDNAGLDFGISPDGWGYAVFGTVTEGMEVVDQIVAVRTISKGQYTDVPASPILIKSARIEGAPAPAPAAKPAAAPAAKPAAPAAPKPSPKP